MDIVEYNRLAWNKQSIAGSQWCTPVGREVIARAREGDWAVMLTPNRPVPRAWLGDVLDKQVLCLASGGGQQAPVLAAAGARVVSFDNSEEQLAKDRFVAERDGLSLTCVQGDMANLSVMNDECFDLIVHPVSNVFAPDVRAVWRECFRVLKRGGTLLAGFINPSCFLFDHVEAQRSGELRVKYALPYADLFSVDPQQRQALFDSGEALEFGHTLDDQIGGQLDAGFFIAGLYEDDWSDEETLLNKFSSTFIVTRAIKP